MSAELSERGLPEGEETMLLGGRTLGEGSHPRPSAWVARQGVDGLAATQRLSPTGVKSKRKGGWRC